MGIQETFSVSELQRLCAKSEYLDESDIKQGDKVLSFDGNIIYYINKKGKATGEELFIPIQIKGKEVNNTPSNKYKYSILVRDLKNYYNNGGVIFIVCTINSKNKYEIKMFAKILLPVDIKKILPRINNQKTVGVELSVCKNHVDLEVLCKHYYDNKIKQSIYILNNPPVHKDKPKGVCISSIIETNVNPAMAIMQSDSTYVYEIRDGIEIPIILSDFYTSTTQNSIFGLDEKTWNFSLKQVYRKDRIETIISDVILIVKNNKKLTFKIVDFENQIFDNMYNVAEYLLELYSAKKIWINNKSNQSFEGNPFKSILSVDFRIKMKKIMEVGSLLDSVHIDKKTLTIKDAIDSIGILNILAQAFNEKTTVSIDVNNDNGIMGQKIGSKIIILEYEKIKKNKYIIRDFFRDGEKIQIRIIEGKETLKVNKWGIIPQENIANTLFDREQMLHDYSTQLIKQEEPVVVMFILELLKAYDENKDKQSLDFAQRLNEIYGRKDTENEVFLVNKYQILKRKSQLKNEDIVTLRKLKIKNNDNIVHCSLCLILDEFDEFELIYGDLDESAKLAFRDWPIYTLYINK